MEKAFCLINNDYFKEIDETKVEELIDDGILMNCIIKSDKEGDLYHFFYDNTNNRERSKIPFFDIGNFPDGVFINFGTGPIEVYICELKKSPSNVNKISKQLYSGYVHSKVILKMMNCKMDDIKYNFKVVLIEDMDFQNDYNEKSFIKKVIPGSSVQENNVYTLWKENKIEFKHKGYSSTINFDKVIMDQVDDGEYQCTLTM